jgi:hypothetical protein
LLENEPSVSGGQNLRRRFFERQVAVLGKKV